jgi:hypothetical protein
MFQQFVQTRQSRQSKPFFSISLSTGRFSKALWESGDLTGETHVAVLVDYENSLIAFKRPTADDKYVITLSKSHNGEALSISCRALRTRMGIPDGRYKAWWDADMDAFIVDLKETVA